MSEKDIVLVENVNALELFTKDGLDPLLAEIEKKATDFTPDTESDKGRKEIASMAYKVSKAKTVIESAGKGLVADWKNRAKVVDESRRASREFLDNLRDRVRFPLTEWESEESRKKEEIRKAFELERWMKEAHAEDEIWEREQTIKVQQAELERQQEERAQKEADEKAEAEREEAARIQAEGIRKAAEEKAQREAEETIKLARDEAEEAERDRIKAEERREREAKEATERARLTAELAEKEKTEAVERERKRAADAEAERERKRIEMKEMLKREDEYRAADRENRRKVNSAIVKAMGSEGIDEATAKKVVTLVASGSIPAMSIRY
jgi:colicin import membrane protein